LVDVDVQVYEDTGVTLITSGVTDTDGELAISLVDGDYLVRMFSVGVTFVEQTFTVAGAPLAEQLEGATITVSPPSAPGVCRLYAFFTDFDGTALQNQKVVVRNLFAPGVLGTTKLQSEVLSDVTGLAQVDVVQGAKIRISIVNTSLVRELTVPAASTADMLTLLGAVSDPFQVVSS